MSKKYRCVEVISGQNFTVGKVYTLTDDGIIYSDDGFPFGPHTPDAVTWLENKGWYKFEEVSDMEFTLSSIKTGDMIRTAAGELMVAMCGCGNGSDFFCTFYSVFPGKYEEVDRWNEDLSHRYLNEYSIVEVRRPDGTRFDLLNLQEEWDDAEVLWVREPIRKKMTVEDIERELGYKVAIVDEEGK